MKSMRTYLVSSDDVPSLERLLLWLPRKHPCTANARDSHEAGRIESGATPQHLGQHVSVDQWLIFIIF